jgi:hypothetical protein
MMRTLPLLLVLLFAPLGALAQEATLPAPYQVEGLVVFKNDRHRLDDGLGLTPPRLTVDLGDAEGAPHPGSAGWQRVTVIGSAGVAQGTLDDIRKTCDYLCGDAAAECHYQGLFVLDRPVEAIGTPLAALPGHHALAGFRPLRGEAAQFEGGLPALATGRDFAPLAWTPYGEEGPRLRITDWRPKERALALQGRWRDGEPFPVAGRACRSRQVEDLTELRCDGVALVLDGARPLLFSYPDYNLAAAEVVAAFESGGTTYYLLRQAIKAQTVFGLLFRDAAGWRALFRPRDYALLC